MALSDQATFALTVNDVIQEAYDRIGGDPILGYDVRSARRSLNIMFSDWANRGYNQWTVEEKDLTIVKSTISYDLPADTIDIINANIKESNGLYYAMSRLGLNDYSAIQNKATESRPTQFYLQRTSTPKIYLYPAPDDSTDVVNYWRIRRIMDITASTVAGVEQNTDVPSRAIECMCSGLTFFLSQKRPNIDINRRAELKLDYESAFERLIAGDDSPSTRIIPSTSYYNGT
jgi:hypothetical protein|tara:strand:- start:1214 stop:1906 length:693 start_codon:yes stop_codon:yes gene_type:complete